MKRLLSLGTFSKPLLGIPQAVAVDSRLVQPGMLFFALAGEKVDGHAFLQEAYCKGAVGAVIRSDFQGEVPSLLPIMRVTDPLSTLQKFASLTVAAANANIFALTGSIGKTTTKDFVTTIVSQGKKIVSSQGSQNSQIGLSLSLLNSIQGGEEWIIAEMGMTHAGHITKLSAIAPPDVALITNVSLVHAENFASLEAIAQAKSEIFEREKTVCLFNADTACAEVLAKAARGRGKTFSTKSTSAYWFMRVLEDRLIFQEDGIEYTVPKPEFFAPHVYENLLAAIAASRTIGSSWDEIVQALPQLRMPSLRLEHKTCRGIHFINDSFNACEQSMIAALDVLKITPGRRKIAVLGAMKELGSFSEQCHRNVWNKAYEVADSIYSLGQEWSPMVDLCKDTKNKYVLASSLDELIRLLEKDLVAGDCVLLKGSRWANQLWKVVDYFSG